MATTMTLEVPNTTGQKADSNATLESPANGQKTNGSSKPSKPPAAQSKLTYVQMVTDAIIAMKDRTGSSQVAIKKYLLSKHPELTPDKLKSNLNKALKSGLKTNRFVKNKASFKIHPAFRKQMKAKKSTAKKKTKNEVAANREEKDDRQAAKEKARLDRIRKRKFPMEDCKLIAEDKELSVTVKLPRRPTLGLVFPDAVAACKTDTKKSGLLEDVFVVYHFFRGDIGWGLDERRQVAPFTLQHLLECVHQIVLGSSKRARMIPPLVVHLFTVALQNLVPEDLQVALTASSWSEVLVLYMDAMERFCEISQAENAGELTGHPIDMDFLLGENDEPTNDEELLQPVSQGPYYFDTKLAKVHSKLFSHDPWMLSADELFCLLRALIDDLVASSLDIPLELDNRLQATTELLKNKRNADAHYRKLQTTRNKELLEHKQEEKERIENGIKATRSNTKSFSVSEAQLESAKRSQHKASSLYEKAMQRKRIRTLPIGHDRQYNEYYHFHNDPSRVFVMKRGKAIPSPFPFKLQDLESFRGTWQSVGKRSVLEAVKESLDVRGEREFVLSQALEPVCKLIFDDIKESSEIEQQQKGKQELERKLENAKLKCEFGRKSDRLISQSKKEITSLQAEVDSLEHRIDIQSKLDGDVEEATGLNVLRRFDRSGAVSRASFMHSSKSGRDRRRRVQCSNLWPTGGDNGTGLVGYIVRDLLDLEDRVERLAGAYSIDRITITSNLETACQAWQAHNVLPVEKITKVVDAGETKNDTLSIVPRAPSQMATILSANQILTMLKQPLLLLEDRVFQLSGLSVASRDAEDADDNMSTSPEEEKAEELGYEWKRLVHRLRRIPAKAHSKIRSSLVEAISAARKGQNAIVVAELRDALLQYHPGAAGACKAAALSVLEQHGDFMEEDNDFEEHEDADTMKTETTEKDFAAALSAEAVVLSSSLDGREDATREDWINAVKRAKTFSKIAALAAGFYSKASKKLDKIEEEHDALMKAIKTWEKAAVSKRPSKNGVAEPSEVWADVDFTDEFCLAKIEPYPWWPARKVIARDVAVGDALRDLDRCLVSLVGELGGLRVVKSGSLLPFSEELPADEDLTSYSKDIQDQLDDCMTMTRRIIRGRSKAG